MFEFLAVDLGATSGRIAIGRIDKNSISLDIVHRFLHEVLPQSDGSLLWDWNLIFGEIIKGLREAIKQSNPVSLAVDSWAVDFGFIDGNNQLLPPIHAYRDPRNEVAFQELTSKIGKERIYSATGIQFLPFNTIYQLYAAKNLIEYHAAVKFLMLPDLVNFLLTKKLSTEVTNASSTQVLNTSTRKWDRELINLAEIREDLFTELHEPGTLIGVVRGYDELDGINVVATASHDTASAIAGVPFINRKTEAYISSGTWSLVGVELDAPILSPEAYKANITNELGADGTVRVLKNVTGMWILEECRRSWHLEGRDYKLPELLALALESNHFKTLIDPNHPLFAPPREMPQRIHQYCVEKGILPPQSDGEYTFCILNSLAHAYKKTLDEITEVTGCKIEVIHILGGGSQNDFLNQLTANICKKIVKTGPIEATLFGNIAVQAISAGVVANLTEARALIGKSFTSKIFYPETHKRK